MNYCAATTRKGERCKVPALRDEMYCHIHLRQKRAQRFISLSVLASAIVVALGLLADVVGLIDYIDTRRKPSLDTSFSANYQDAVVEVSNIGTGITKISNLHISSEYQSCPYFVPPPIGGRIQEYKYNLTLSPNQSIYVFDENNFKYGTGELDRFIVSLDYEQLGVYKIRFGYDYQNVGDGKAQWQDYESVEECLAICFSAALPQNGFSPMNESGTCEELPYRAFPYVVNLVASSDESSRGDAIEFARKNFPPCEELREEYIEVIRKWDAELREEGFPISNIDDRIASTPECPY